MKGGLDAGIERLYQLPLEDFTAARNALAKGAGTRAADVRALVKPPLAAWAVNQIYWRRRAVYDALIHAAEEMRRAHAAVLAGRAADVRAAGKAHDARVAEALDAALEILGDAGHPATDATRQALSTTLRALPADEESGQLARTLQPGGFEALAGLSIKGARPPALKPTAKSSSTPAPAAKSSAPSARETKALAKAREAVASAARALKLAEHAAQREEFERARAAREEETATKAVAAGRKSLEDAQSELRDAEAAAETAAKKKASAQRRAEQAEAAVDAARAKLSTAQQAFDAAGKP
jgi:hypothetical protein